MLFLILTISISKLKLMLSTNGSKMSIVDSSSPIFSLNPLVLLLIHLLPCGTPFHDTSVISFTTYVMDFATVTIPYFLGNTITI
ncbi:MAG: hypothetical protein QXT73_07690 [Candidatus Methanomethylicaceae archaeon]